MLICSVLDFFNIIRYHFCSLSGSECFLLGNYTAPSVKKTRGWTSKQGNPDLIFSGYMPAIFRELYALTGDMIADKKYYTSYKVKNHIPENWGNYFTKIEKIIENFKYEEFLDNIFKHKNEGKGFLEKASKHHNLDCKIFKENDGIQCLSNNGKSQIHQSNFSNAKSFILSNIKGKNAFFILCFMFTLLNISSGNLLDDVAIALFVEIIKEILIEEWKK